jgi:hypothetical protein
MKLPILDALNDAILDLSRQSLDSVDAGIAANVAEEATRIIEALAEALEPFAAAANNFDGFNIKNAGEWFAYGGQQSNDDEAKGAITVSDLRRARAAIALANGK